jgi:hypothetical protein
VPLLRVVLLPLERGTVLLRVELLPPGLRRVELLRVVLLRLERGIVLLRLELLRVVLLGLEQGTVLLRVVLLGLEQRTVLLRLDLSRDLLSILAWRSEAEPQGSVPQAIGHKRAA